MAQRTRRAGEILDELRTSASTIVPGWAGVDADGDVGAAVYRIAARIGEQVARRIARMPDRDRLAFFETLELPGGVPRAASVPLVFTLAEARTTRVEAPARMLVGTRTGNIPFETSEALQIAPTRIGTIVTADAETDRIERAPSGVGGAGPRAQAPFAAHTLGPAEPGRATLQMSRTEGLKTGDVLRVGTALYRVATVAKDSDLVGLQDPIATPVAAGAPVVRIDDLEAFALRDEQEHRLYIAHKDLLNLNQPGDIRLTFDPPGLAAQLPAVGTRAWLWGKRGAAKDPGWHALDPAGVDGAVFTLRKSWTGAVEEVAVHGRKSRWLRIDLTQPIDPAAPPDIAARALHIAVETPNNPSEESPSVTLAYHNALPLALSGPFLPFGPEPQRFDTFAIAAPETLSKLGAQATIHITLADATPDAFMLAAGRPRRAYAIGKDGVPYAFTLPAEPPGPDAPVVPRWRALAAPTEDDAANAAKRVALDGAGRLAAVAISTEKDIVVASDAAGRLWVTYVFGEDVPVVRRWSPVPPPEGVAWLDWTLLCTSDDCVAVALAPDGLYMTMVDGAGIPADSWGWTRVTADPAVRFGATARLAGQVGRDWPHTGAMDALTFALVDQDGDLVVGQVDPEQWTVTWRNSLRSATPDVRPMLIERDDGHVLVAADADRAVFAVVIPADAGAIVDLPPSDVIAATGSALMPAPADVAGPAGTAIWTAAGLAVWTQGYPAQPIDLSPERATRGVVFPATDGRPPSLMIAGSSEAILTRALPVARAVDGVLSDAVAAQRTPSLVAVGPLPAPTYPVQATGIVEGTTELIAIDQGVVGASDVIRLYDEAGQGFTATIDAGASVRLDASDTLTTGDSVLLVGGALYAVASRTGTQAVLVQMPPGAVGSTFGYATGAATDPEPIAAGMRARLFQVSGDEDVSDRDRIVFGGTASPAVQGVAAQDGNWVKLDQPWAVIPEHGSTPLVVTRATGGWTATSFVRSFQSPELSWEYSDGISWRRIEALSDGTANLAGSGEVRFRVPDDLAPTDVAGKKDLWIRARLTGGDYGRAKYEIQSQDQGGGRTLETITVNTRDLAPPEIVSIRADFALLEPSDPQTLLAVNNLAVLDQTQAALEAGAWFDLFPSIRRHVAAAAGGAGEDSAGRAIYVCLDTAPDVAVLNLFVDAWEEDDAEAALAVQMLRADGWTDVGAFEDETHGLSRAGMLRLPIGAGPAELPLFGRTGWWLRFYPRGNPGTAWMPRVRGLYLNAAIAVQARTLVHERVGSSDGSPGQAFALAEWPVVADSLELRIREALGDEEVDALRAGDPLVVLDPVPNIPGSWVRWAAVNGFAGYDGDARVFRIDPATGVIRFGDGRRGRVPPAGADGIRAFAYRAGGGARGNVAADTITNAKSAIASLETVTNPVAARGGADVVGDGVDARDRASRREPRPYVVPDAGVQASAVARIRDAGRIVAPVDIEAFVRAAAPDIAGVRCLRGDGGFTVVVALRDPAERAPRIARARREGLAAALAERNSGAVPVDAIRVVAPRFVRVRIAAALHVARGDRAVAVDIAARRALLDLLDPAIGPGGSGGRFGRGLEEVDVYRALADIDGLDRVDTLTITWVDPAPATLAPDMLVYGEETDAVIAITIGDGR